MDESPNPAADARRMLEEIFFPRRLGGRQSRTDSLSVVAFAEYLESQRTYLPGKRSRKYNSVREHLNKLMEKTSSDKFLFETLEVVHGFLIFKKRIDLSSKAETILVEKGGERDSALKQRLCLKGGVLLAYVADPTSYAHLRDDWRIMTMHGEDDLFRFSCAVFISEWLDSIDVHTSAPEVLNLAVDMSRVAFTYGDYVLAKRICAKIIHSPNVWEYSGPNLMSLFDAHRLYAEAVSFSRITDGLVAFHHSYEDVTRRLNNCRFLSEEQREALEIRHDDVLIRTMVRLSLANSVRELASDQELGRVFRGLSVPVILERLKERLYTESKISGELIPRDDPNLRFIFFDTYVRALAVLRGEVKEATERLTAIKAKHFNEEYQYEECFRRHGRTPPPDMVKVYRLRTTEAMIRCYRVKRMIDADEVQAKVQVIRRLAASAKESIALVLAPTDHATMQHTRNLAALLGEFLSSQESRLLDRVMKLT